MDIDITDVCNLKCPFCLRQSNPELIKNEFMSFNTFRKIINEGAENGLYGCKLNIIGEPLLHNDVFGMIRYAKEKGLIDVYINTNGYFLTEENCRKLILSGIDRISISFEGYTKDVYEKYRVGSNFERVVNNIKTLQKIKKELDSEKPKIRVQTVLLPELEKDIDNYIKFWEKIVDEVGFLDYQPRIEHEENIFVNSDWCCSQLWQRMGILVDGTIIPCNHDEKKLMSLGNVKDTKIKDAWHSNKMDVMRMQHKMGMSNILNSCKNCYLRQSEVLKEIKNDSGC